MLVYRSSFTAYTYTNVIFYYLFYYKFTGRLPNSDHLTDQMSEIGYNEKGVVIYIPNSGAFEPSSYSSSNIFSSLYEPKDEKSPICLFPHTLSVSIFC
jgi:hypothetical protein